MLPEATVYVYDNTLKAIRITGRQLREYLEYSAKYFHRVGADGRPVDVTAGSGVDVPGYSNGVAVGDVDGGLIDVFVDDVLAGADLGSATWTRPARPRKSSSSRNPTSAPSASSR